MTTHFIEAEIDLTVTNADTDLRQAIESQLKSQGEPLRWAIAAVNDKTACVEAVILKASHSVA
ncbi:MAG: hypothetical protein WCD18_12795 [Thermosynechococcaceae cyanobacterium]